MWMVTDGSVKELQPYPGKIQKYKKYFYIATANGASKDFVKFVFHEPGKENGPFIIQYIGNDEISQAHAHGIAKKL